MSTESNAPEPPEPPAPQSETPAAGPTHGLLSVILEGKVVQAYPLSDAPAVIGRAEDCQIVLQHPFVSRRHAEVRFEEGKVHIVDLASASGTYIGEAKLDPNVPVVVESGATFGVGPFFVTYVPAGGAPPAEATAAAAPEPVPAPVIAAAVPPPPPRSVLPVPPPPGPLSAYLADLPGTFHGSDFLGRFLLMFEALWEPLEQRQTHLPMYFDPRTAPAQLLPWLGSWLGVTVNPRAPESRQRRLVAEAIQLNRARGTREALARVIEIVTDVTPSIVDDPERPFTFRVTIALPPGSDARREQIEALIREYKPAHVGYVLEVTS